MNLGLGLPIGSPLKALGGAPAVNPNLLTKTQQFDAAAWAKTNCTVTANAGTDPLGGSTADLVDLSFGVGAVIAQTSGLPCTTATGAASATLTGSPTRFSVVGTVDGASYTYSLWMSDPAAPSVQIRFDAAGGFVKISVKDIGDGAVPLCWGAKLEAGSSATGDATNYGAVA